jgi:hypothetical protein
MTEPGEGPVADAREALEGLLLGGPRRYTRLQVAQMSGMAPERTLRLWRALGFPDAADDDPAFTDADIEALNVLSTPASSDRRTRRRSPARWDSRCPGWPTGRPTCSRRR